MLTDIELGTLEIVEEILKTVSSLADALAGEKEVTVSAIPCILKHIKNKFSPSSTGTLAEDMKHTLLEDIEIVMILL